MLFIFHDIQYEQRYFQNVHFIFSLHINGLNFRPCHKAVIVLNILSSLCLFKKRYLQNTYRHIIIIENDFNIINVIVTQSYIQRVSKQFKNDYMIIFFNINE